MQMTNSSRKHIFWPLKSTIRMSIRALIKTTFRKLMRPIMFWNIVISAKTMIENKKYIKWGIARNLKQKLRKWGRRVRNLHMKCIWGWSKNRPQGNSKKELSGKIKTQKYKRPFKKSILIVYSMNLIKDQCVKVLMKWLKTLCKWNMRKKCQKEIKPEQIL